MRQSDDRDVDISSDDDLAIGIWDPTFNEFQNENDHGDGICNEKYSSIGDSQSLLEVSHASDVVTNDYDMHRRIEYQSTVDDQCHISDEFQPLNGSGASRDVISGDVNTYFESENVIGLQFPTTDDAYNFYNRYALQHGFGIRIHCPHRNRVTNEIIRMVYVCNKQGFKRVKKDTRDFESEKKRRRDTRTGCEAMFRVQKIEANKWVVDKFDDSHNHVLLRSPSKIIKQRSHRKFQTSSVCKSLVSTLNESGLRPSHITRAVNALSGDVVANITTKNVSHMLSARRKNNVGKECIGIVKYFQEKAMADSSFYFDLQLDDGGTMRNVFWADGRSRSAYMSFADVIVFDVTYKTNKFRMPFAPFVGVNHHRQSVLLGAALIEDETEQTFVWIFESFIRCMFGKIPIAIITDQDIAMRKAIEKVFPSVRHRFCSWHIMKHFSEHLQSYKAKSSDFQEDFNKMLRSESIPQFEECWDELRLKHDIMSNSWLSKTYELRRHWAKPYLKDVFFAGMTTSGRSESINSFFDGYVNSNTMLNDFVVQYDKALKSRRAAEEEEDFRTMNSTAMLSSQHLIELKAAQKYTRNIYELFRKEWICTLDCGHETITKGAELTVYKVGVVTVERSRWKTVFLHSGDVFNATCSCAKFETLGIFCKHVLYIMKKKNIMDLPDQYILRRWTLAARFTIDNTDGESSNKQTVSPVLTWETHANFKKVMDGAKESPSDVKKINDFLLHMIEDQEKRDEVVPIIRKHGSQEVEGMLITVRDPIAPKQTKGRPNKASRLQSGIEKSMKEKKMRTCSYCQSKGHYATSCALKKANDLKSTLQM